MQQLTKTALKMKYSIVFLAFIFVSCTQKITIDERLSKYETYKIILRTEIPEPKKDPDAVELYTTEIPGEIDSLSVTKLSEPLKALAAFYSAMGGSYCGNDYCGLTTALGLGKQGSNKHQNLIKKYFPEDKVAEAILKQNCYLRPSGASSFSDYEFLTILNKGDTVTVDYRLMYYDHGETSWTKGPDIYLFKENKFKKIKRNLWTFVEP